jgi:hypothetical protein
VETTRRYRRVEQILYVKTLGIYNTLSDEEEDEYDTF